MKHRKIKKGVALVLIIIGIFICMGYVALLFLLKSPAVLNFLASKSGYDISARDVSLSPGLSGHIDDLVIKDTNTGLTIVCSDVSIKNSLLKLMTGKMDTLVFKNPKLIFQSSSRKLDFSFLEKLPDVKLLDIQNAEVEYSAGHNQKLKLTHCDLTVRDFSVKKGADISVQSNFSFRRDENKLSAKGTIAAKVRLETLYTNKLESLKGKIDSSFKDVQIDSPATAFTTQGNSGSTTLAVNYAIPEQKVAFNIVSIQQPGELLWKDYYNNFKGQKTSIKADGMLSLSGDASFSLHANLDIFQTGDYSFMMKGNKNDWSLKAVAAKVSHKNIIEKIFKEYLSNTSSGLKGFSATGYSSLNTIIWRKNGTTYVTGQYTMTDTAIHAPDMQFSIGSISAILPLDFVHPSSARQDSTAGLLGNIRFQNIQRKRLAIDTVRIPVMIAQNRLAVPEPVIIPFFLGKIHIYNIVADDLLSPDMQLKFGLTIENINLGRMTKKFLDVELPGAVNADFGMMKYQQNRLLSEGTAKINVFDGEIIAKNFFAEDITKPSRKIGGDIFFQNINLEKMTRKIPVGSMSGIIQGSLQAFVMEYGQPASFVLEIESVKKSGIEQEISADAIENISVLGTGAGSVLSRGVTKYFKNFPYSKIGIRCVLRNDQFRINGTLMEDGTEYLIRRGFFRGVDVVNQNPENAISFRDMVERLNRMSKPVNSEEIQIQ